MIEWKQMTMQEAKNKMEVLREIFDVVRLLKGSDLTMSLTLAKSRNASIHLFLYGQLFLVEKLVAQRHWGNRCIRYPVISP